MSETVDDFLMHYGVPGMKWGKRNSSKSGDSEPARKKMTPEEKKVLVKKVAIGASALVLAAGTAYVIYKLNDKGKTKTSNLTISTKAKEETSKVLQEPTGIVFYGRAKNRGFRFIQDGGTPTPLAEFTKGFQGNYDQPGGYFHKYDGKIAAVLLDPEGRKDHAGRVIPHNLIVPKSMADGVNNIEDVASKIWPKLKDVYIYD